jgi:hypothetical protein
MEKSEKLFGDVSLETYIWIPMQRGILKNFHKSTVLCVSLETYIPMPRGILKNFHKSIICLELENWFHSEKININLATPLSEEK